MTVDRYTKTLLTIIAACLLLQTLLALDRVAFARGQAGAVAQPAPTPVYIYGWDRNALPLPVAIEQRDPVSVTLAQPAKLAYTPDNPLPASINGIRKGSSWDSIHAHIDPQEMGAPGSPRR